MMMILPSNDIIFTLQYQTLSHSLAPPPSPSQYYPNLILSFGRQQKLRCPLSSVCVSTFVIEFFLSDIEVHRRARAPPPFYVAKRTLEIVSDIFRNKLHSYMMRYAVCWPSLLCIYCRISIDFAQQLFCVHRQKMCRIPLYFCSFFRLYLIFHPPPSETQIKQLTYYQII